MIGIICAMKEELHNILSFMRNRQKVLIANIEFIRGKIANYDCVLSVSGIGKVNSAMCTQIMILKFHPRYIINIGVGGSLTSKIGIGDIVIADDVVQHDFDLSAFGRKKGIIPNVKTFGIKCSTKLINKFIEISKNIKNYNIYVGRILSGDKFISDAAIIKQLHSEFNGLACEMEGASIGQVCELNDVDFLVVRAISDNADGSANVDFKQFLQSSTNILSDLIWNAFNSKIL